MRRLSLGRIHVRRPSLTAAMTKTRWALSGEKEVTNLIEMLAVHIRDLEELFSGQRDRQATLANEEVNTLGGEQVKLLKDLQSESKVQDKVLLAAYEQAMRTTYKNQYNTIFGAHNQGANIAHAEGGTFNFGRHT